MTVSCHCIANVDGRCAAKKCEGEITAFDAKVSGAEQARRLYEAAVLIFSEMEEVRRRGHDQRGDRPGLPTGPE